MTDLPYAFWNENFGAAVGYAYAAQGRPQPQAALLGTLMVGENGSVTGFAAGRDIRVFGLKRLFLDPVLSAGRYADLEAYVDGNPAFPDQRAGSHASDPHDFIQGRGNDTFFRLRFKYLLPIGHGRDQVLPGYAYSGGLLVSGESGATSWNPLLSGRTFVDLRPFYRSQDIRTDALHEEQNTNGIELGLTWDNRDDPGNPSRGQAMSLRLTRDFGWGDSSTSWTNVAAEFDHYVPLRPMPGSRQSVLAFDAWTSWSPSWDARPDGTIAHRPPAFSGATLGGLFRMRAYPSQRFSDKAAVYLAAEWRVIPAWNPFARHAWLRERVGVEWIQFAGFIEGGRVAPTFEALGEDLHWNAGIGVRLWAQGAVGRLDFAWSGEGLGVQMMVGQPFQF